MITIILFSSSLRVQTSFHRLINAVFAFFFLGFSNYIEADALCVLRQSNLSLSSNWTRWLTVASRRHCRRTKVCQTLHTTHRVSRTIAS